jgi:hypothetical protein
MFGLGTYRIQVQRTTTTSNGYVWIREQAIAEAVGYEKKI